jgi:hypothetical protein
MAGRSNEETEDAEAITKKTKKKFLLGLQLQSFGVK